MPLDEVKAGNNITAQLKKLMLPQSGQDGCARGGGPGRSKLSLALAK